MESKFVLKGPTSSDFLNAPREVRTIMYEYLLEDVNWERGDHWFLKPEFQLVELKLTCRQIYEEMKEDLPLQLTNFNKVYDLAEKFLHSSASRSNDLKLAKHYRSLTVEFDLQAPSSTYDKLIDVLYWLSPFLQELRLYFRGHDRHQNRLYVHDCASVKNQTSRTAPISGQRGVETRNIQGAIRNLAYLRILVVSNMNAQIYPAMFMYKPQLQYCHLTADPRSVVHWPGTAQLGEFAIIPTEYFPPIKVLQISANNMLNAFSLPSNCALTLEHLTWTVPDAKRGSNLLNLDLFQNTEQLIDNLIMNARKLKTLRICIQGRGRHGHRNEFLSIEAAVTERLKRLDTLRDVELHIDGGSQTLGYDILDHLPSKVERFYTNDHLVKPQQLYNFITKFYLFATQGPPNAAFLARQKQLLESWYPTPRNEIEYGPTDKETIKLWIHPTTYGPIDDHANDLIDVSEHPEPIGTQIIRKLGTKPKAFFVYGIIGEDLHRKDYIPLRGRNLKFVSYEFSNPDHKCRSGGVGETTTQMVLRLNGRLLDRERNRHLGAINPGDPIEPMENTGQSSCLETATDSENIHIWQQLGELYFGPGTESDDSQQVIAELMRSDFTDDKQYFGREDEAMKVFEQERVARPEDLPPLTYPYYEDSVKDDKCHWLCPDSSVRSIPQMNHTIAVNAARRQAMNNTNANSGTDGNTNGSH